MMYGRRLRGFTLLELLVVMGLLSAVMLALGAALRTIAQSEDRVDHRLAQADELRVASAFMRTTLGRVSARKMAPAPASGASPVLFAAAPEALAWAGVMPARYGQGGRQYFRLGIEPAGAEAACRALGLAIVPLTAPATLDGGDVLQVGNTLYVGRGGRTLTRRSTVRGERGRTGAFWAMVRPGA